MKKIIPVWLTVLIAAIVVSGPVEVVSNLLADAGVDCEVSMWMLTAETGQ